MLASLNDIPGKTIEPEGADQPPTERSSEINTIAEGLAGEDEFRIPLQGRDGRNPKLRSRRNGHPRIKSPIVATTDRQEIAARQNGRTDETGFERGATAEHVEREERGGPRTDAVICRQVPDDTVANAVLRAVANHVLLPASPDHCRSEVGTPSKWSFEAGSQP